MKVTEYGTVSNARMPFCYSSVKLMSNTNLNSLLKILLLKLFLRIHISYNNYGPNLSVSCATLPQQQHMYIHVVTCSGVNNIIHNQISV